MIGSKHKNLSEIAKNKTRNYNQHIDVTFKQEIKRSSKFIDHKNLKPYFNPNQFCMGLKIVTPNVRNIQSPFRYTK